MKKFPGCHTGFNFSVCVSNEGNVYTFGANDSGQLGREANQRDPIPRKVSALPVIREVSCGYAFTICLDEFENLWGFGSNNTEQLAVITLKHFEPIQIPNISGVKSICCGSSHTLCIKNDSDSSLWSFGDNLAGQLFLSQKSGPEPQKTSFSNVINVAAGFSSSFCQLMNGEIYCCGENSHGQLGTGNNKHQKLPILIPNLPPNIISMECGGYYTLLLDDNGNVYGTGYNCYGELGLGVNESRNSFSRSSLLPAIKSIHCGYHHSICIDEYGEVWIFGYNIYGQLGVGMNIGNGSKSPQKLSDIKYIRSVSHGFGHHTILKQDGIVYVFGNNDNGQLGLSPETTTKLSKPVPMKEEFYDIVMDVFVSTAKSARK